MSMTIPAEQRTEGSSCAYELITIFLKEEALCPPVFIIGQEREELFPVNV